MNRFAFLLVAVATAAAFFASFEIEFLDPGVQALDFTFG